MRNVQFVLILFSLILLVSCSRDTKSDSLEAKAQSIVQSMTVEEKIGQVIQADISAVTPEDVKMYNLGSVLNGGNSAPGGGVTASPEEWIALADAFWLASTDKTDGGVGIPILWGTDAVHGHNNLQNATIFPHNSALGAMRDPVLMRSIAAVTAAEVRATGIDWTFAPTLAVARDDRWGRAYESYSENPALVSVYADSMVIGLQGEESDLDFLKGEHVIATAKHFIGDGGTQFGIDKGDTQGPESEIIKIHGAPYLPAIKANVQTVMASFSSVNGQKMHASSHLLEDVLRGQMGFDGFVVGDWNGHAEIPGCTATDCIQALMAGVDMYMAPDSWKGLYNSLLVHANDGTLDMARLDQAVTRIIRVKLRAGLISAGLPSKRTATNPDQLGSPQHRAIAREAVRKSLVLLKNSEGTLPINAGSHVLVTGSGANSMQQQTGGWTLSWQGDNNPNDAFLTGETIFAGLEAAVSESGGSAELSTDGSFTQKPDIAIVVYGEPPYAEYRGDRSDLVFEFASGENLALIKRLKAEDIPVVSVFLTGRPLWVNPHLNASDAFVVAWLPGTEGGGVADVLVGDTSGNPRRDFNGKLAFSWPADGMGKPINGPADSGVLYPYGYGLTYEAKDEFQQLSENSGLPEQDSLFTGPIIMRGDAARPLSLYVGDSSNLNTPVTALKTSSLGGGISVSGTDYKAQEDSRQIMWSGDSPANLSVRTARPIDISALGSPANLGLELQWRIDAPVTAPLTLTMGCGEGCNAALDISSLASSLPVGTWQSTKIPLTCFTDAGLASDHVQTLLQLSSDAKTGLSIYEAQIEASSDSAACPPVKQ